jgi:uridylate kinase
MSDTSPRFRRILLKLSGEGFAPPGELGIDPDQVRHVAGQLKAVVDMGVQVAAVVRGAKLSAASDQIHRATADNMGMLGTVLNGLALRDTLESIGCPARLLSAIRMDVVSERYIRGRAIRHLDKGRVVILAGGTGNPYFTTDTTAALRAVELGVDVLFKATQVDGVYSADPAADPTATRFDRLTYQEVIERRLRIMDMAAYSLCMDNNLPILVFNLHEDGNVERAVRGDPIGTIIGETNDAQR